MDLALGEIAALVGSTCGAPERVVRGYSIDSRTLEAGALFFAIRGPHSDGHSFVEQALERGAVGAVVERDWAAQAPARITPGLIPVEETVSALQELGRAVRRRWGRRLVAVTGSVGKTTTKEMIAAVLAARYAVHKSAGNLNNHLGVPLTLLELTPAHEVAVLELAMSHTGEIARLAQIAAPCLGVVTNVAPVHLEFFDSLDAIARAKRELLENLAPPSLAVLNGDDVRVRSLRDGYAGGVITYGFEPGADFQATEFCLIANGGSGGVGSAFRVRGPEGEAHFRMRLPGRHHVENALAAIVVGRVWGLPVEAIAAALENLAPLGRRGEVVRLPGGATLINDCYNSNPRAMEQMLELLRDWPGAERRIVLAGEMLELGPSAPVWHRAVGRKCAECGVEWLLAVQGEAQRFLDGAVEAGLAPEHARFFLEAAEAGSFCRSILRAGDVVLVKGSRAVHMERAVERMVA
jgi:UDP-N-acetylmuramoyl-tripeptide--D-alanyl-D-alanine ligase